MSNETSPSTSAAAEATAANPPDRKLKQLWEVLEDEFHDIHQLALEQDATYVSARDGAIANAERQRMEAIRHRPGGATLSDEQLLATAKSEMLHKPSLINAPACRELFRRVHEFVEKTPGGATKHSALCLSGGGIRSATFALGVLQGLARQGVLADFAYLSTVSGGGYIGSWLSSWIKHSGQKSGAVFQALGATEKPTLEPGKTATSAAESEEPKQPFETEPAPIQHLRQFSNYLTPSVGLLSGDGWAVAATVVRNLLLNWMLLIPALLLVLLLPRVILWATRAQWPVENQWFGYILACIAFASGVCALSNLIARRGKTQTQVLTLCVTPILVFSLLATLVWFWAREWSPPFGWFEDARARYGFYFGWGAFTAIFAAIFSRPTAPPAPDGRGDGKPPKKPRKGVWFIRMATITVVFGLAGVVTCWLGDKVAEQLLPPKLEAAEASDDGVQKTGWVYVSKATGDSRVNLWVPVDDQQMRLLKADSGLPAAPEAAAGNERKFLVSVYSVCLGFPLLVAIIFLANTVLTGLLSRLISDQDREWLARASGWAFLMAVAICSVCIIALRGPVWLMELWDYMPKLLSAVGGGAALLTIGGGGSGATAAVERPDEKPTLQARLLDLAVKCAAPIFIILLLVLGSLLTTLLLQRIAGLDLNPRAHDPALQRTDLLALGIIFGGCALVTAISSLCVNINKFSLHAMYRNRLIRAYLGATNPKRDPNLFTGFDPKDNFGISELRGQRPFHVVNTALNLVSGKNLAWQQRLATSFTMTPLACGSAVLGYRDSAGYARGNDGRGMTLGTALAISGAAVSPNHGYNSSPLIAFLLTFFNARLGGWFGNPGPAGREAWSQSAPTVALQPLIAEAFGFTDSDHSHVYLSDGGHFENLGLYEMVLRRCRTIVVVDAGCDPDYSFEDLGSAVSKIRVDLGIRIVFETDIGIQRYDAEKAKGDPGRGRHCAFGRICYSDVDGGRPEQRDGTLIYIKAAMCGYEPMDVFHYHRDHEEFPHEPTTDQWFTESQFESYRTLGLHSVEQICDNQRISGLGAFIQSAANYVTPTPAPTPAPATPPTPPKA